MSLTQNSATAPNKRLLELSEFKVMEWLFWLRNFMVLVQLAAMVLSAKVINIPLPYWPISFAPMVLLGFNMLVYWRLEKGHRASVFEMTLHLLFDMLVFTYLLYWTGGSGNPFVSAFLVPVALAAVFGSLRHALALGILSIALYSFLMLQHVPLPTLHGRLGGDFSMHVFGMWLNFMLSAVITIGFVTALAKLAREREIALKQAEQESINSQHLIAIGALAAGAAHELGTPLSNIAMLAEECSDPSSNVEEYAENMNAIKAQLSICQSQISILRDQANLAQRPVPLQGRGEVFILEVLARFKAMRPEIAISMQASEAIYDSIVYDISLSQTILNLLNNAADASIENGRPEIEVSYRAKAHMLVLRIDDFGMGINPALESLMGEVPFSSKAQGIGIGLLLAKANVRRMDGELRLINRSSIPTGMRAEISIPFELEEAS